MTAIRYIILLGILMTSFAQANFSSQKKVRGEVWGFDEKEVTLKQKSKKIVVPRRTIATKDLRPGQKATAILRSDEAVRTK